MKPTPEYADGETPDPPEWNPRKIPPRPTHRFGRALVEETATDAANGQHFAFDHAGHLRYVADTQRWIKWAGTHWTDAVKGDLLRAGKETAEGLLGVAVKIQNEEQRKKALAWALLSLNYKRLISMIEMATSELDMEVRAANLDADTRALNVANGTINLRDGVLREHNRGDFITKIVPITYELEARCERWLTFLDEVFAGDEELIAFVQRAVGYTLTGDTREHALFLCWGAGCNGKSIFIEILRALLGDFAVASPMATFTAKRDNGAPTNDLAMLRGARLVTVQESEQGARFSEATVKALTGGDAITARFLNREFFTFLPQFKVWLATNHKPRAKGTDDGFWRRVRLIPFTVSFLGREDKSLLGTLRAELPGILNWALEGCIEWQLRGLGSAGAVAAATEEYREENDTIAAFVKDCLVIRPSAWISSKRAHELYTKWCDDNGEHVCSKRVLTQTLLARPNVTAAKDPTGAQRGLRGLGELADR